MRDRVISLQHTLSDLGSSLVAEHVSGERNVVADHLSRVDVGDAFQLNQFVFADLQCTIGPCTINCFAAMANALLPVFNSYFLELSSSGVDAFAHQLACPCKLLSPPTGYFGSTCQLPAA